MKPQLHPLVQPHSTLLCNFIEIPKWILSSTIKCTLRGTPLLQCQVDHQLQRKMYIFLYILCASLKLGSHRAILFWRWKLKLSPLLFPGDSDIFKTIFLNRPINFYRQLILTKLTLSPNLEEKLFRENKEMVENKKHADVTSGIINFLHQIHQLLLVLYVVWRAIFKNCSKVVLLLYHFLVP